MADIGIVGWGVVGQATGEGFKKAHSVLWHDPHKEGGVELPELIEKSELIFICVPTPMFSDYSGIDLSIVEEVIESVVREIGGARRNRVIIIKSTVEPGTAASLQKKYPDVDFASNPEFLTEAHPFEDFLKPDRTIIGAELSVAERIKTLYESVLPPESIYFLTDTTSAEMAKYMANTLLAAKIMLGNEYYRLSQALGIDYDHVRQMVQEDPRIGGHLNTPGPDGDFGFGGKCFPKDIVALLSLARNLKVDTPILEDTWKENLKVRKNRDWESINGAVSKKREVR